MLELFAKHGAELRTIFPDGSSILQCISLSNDSKTIIEYLIQHGQYIDAVNEEGKTKLVLAAEIGKLDLCRILLEFEADPNLRDNNGMNAIDQVIFHGYTDVGNLLDVLLDAGSEVRLIDDKGKPRFTNLDPELEKLLQEKAASISIEKQTNK